MLALPADPEPLEENQKDEEIVDTERALDNVAGYKFKRRLPAHRYCDPARETGCSQRQPRGS